MIGNIIDYRTNKYRFDVDVIFEPSRHDNSCNGASQFLAPATFMYHEIYNTTVDAACKWANEQDCYTTIFLYDSGSKPGDRIRSQQGTPA
jgi:hypothetical protein